MSKIFKDLQQGNTLYVLVKGDKMIYEESSVVSISAPRAEMPNTNQFPANTTFRQVIDVTYNVQGKTFTDAAEVNSSIFVTTKPGAQTLVATDKQFIVNELKETLKQDEKWLKDVDKLKKRVKDCKSLIGELDTEFKEKEMTENRLAKLEESTLKTNEMLKKILDKMSENKLF
jgi:hypothetical protein